MPGGIDLDPLGSAALITVTELNTYLGETTTGSDKTAAVNGAIAAVEAYCGRTFVSTTYRKWRYLTGGNSLALDDYPITSLVRFASSTEDACSVTFVNADGLSAQVSVVDTTLTCMAMVEGSTNAMSETVALASCDTMADVEAAIEALTETGWSAETLRNDDPLSIRPIAAEDCLNTTVYLETPGDAVRGFTLDADAGLIYLPSSYTGWLYTHYVAGYTTPPYDVKQTALELAAAMLQSAGSDAGISGERIGNYQYTTRDRGALVSQFYTRLDGYKRRSL